MKRGMRNCRIWPPPEVEQLHELAPDVVPVDVTREDMVRIIADTKEWQGLPQFNTATAIKGALDQGDLSAKDDYQCPVLNITSTSKRFLQLFNQCRNYTAGMGGLPSFHGSPADEDVRTIHAFNIIALENERIRKARKVDA